MYTDLELFIPENEKQMKGDFLEYVATCILESYGYHITQQVRLTGMELDLIARSKVTQEDIFVECKFHADTIQSADIDKFIGKCVRKKIKTGLFVHTSSLGKEAKGIKYEMEHEQNPSVKVLFWDREKILEGLQDTYRDILLDTNNANNYNYIMGIGVDRVPFIFYIDTQDQSKSIIKVIRNSQSQPLDVIQSLILTNAKYSGYTIIEHNHDIHQSRVSDLVASSVRDTVVQIIPADDIFDYRPSKPIDFVGRSDLLGQFKNFFADVKNKKTQTRLISLEGPSGYGKSSFLLKLADELSKDKKWRSNCYTYLVDCRSATTGQFVTAALVEAIKEASRSGFLQYPINYESIVSSPDFLTSDGMQSVLNELNKKDKVFVLFFDQFEEILTKLSLNPVFRNLQRLFREVTATECNIIIGFSFRSHIYFQETNEAYYLFRSTEDYRKKFEIGNFKSSDVRSLIKQFEKTKFKVNPPIKRRIEEQSQGLPWLLRKLCIHVFNHLQSRNQSEFMTANMDIQFLFEADLEKLSKGENLCLRYIANNSPVGFDHVIENYGEDNISRLQQQRLIIKTGTNCTIYWDVFKEYLLTGKTPVIPFSSIPQCEITMLLKAIRNFLPDKKLTNASLCHLTNYSNKTVMNVLADLLTLEIIVKDKSRFKLSNTSSFQSDQEISNHLKAILSKHYIVIKMQKQLNETSRISTNRIMELIEQSYAYGAVNKDTSRTYTKRFIKYLEYSGLFIVDGTDVLVNNTSRIDYSLFYTPSKRGLGVLSGSPKKALRLCNDIQQNGSCRKNIEGYRNTMNDLNTLGIIDFQRDTIYFRTSFVASLKELGSIEKAIESQIKQNAFVVSVIEIVLNGTAEPQLIYGLLKRKYDLNWSQSSIKRNVCTALRWVNFYSML